MVNTTDFHKHVSVEGVLPRLAKRSMTLLNEVIERLPDEEQFKITGLIRFDTKQTALDFYEKNRTTFWKHLHPSLELERPAVQWEGFNGNCQYVYETSERSRDIDEYFITIIIDYFDNKTDDFIKGVIVHELSEMSYPCRKYLDNWPSLKKMKPDPRLVWMEQWTKYNPDPYSKQCQEHEANVDNEAIRLGFQKEIDASHILGS